MSIFRNTRRITELTVQNKLFTTPPRIFHGIVNRDKKNSKKKLEIEKSLLELEVTCISRKSFASKRELVKPEVYDITPHNHVDTRNKVLANDLRANRNQIIYHRIFTVPNAKQRQAFFKRPSVNVNWLTKKRDEKFDAGSQSTKRFDKLSSANKAGFFRKTNNRGILMEMEKKVKDKSLEPDTPKKS
ncbi:jg5723 [Pararge aegeria aegeria]|uniref:Jg5723 protein n=1 Tax=Pararge aegeria aegeria TaxID=348720 RepID=A0A8S4SLP5_9NEOP|nr:jg5723 [Pararge aegeria aegeria]